MGIGALFEHENHRGTGLKLIADRFLLLIVRKMLDVTWSHMNAEVLPQVRTAIHGKAWNEIPGGRGLRRMLPGVRWGVS